MAKPELDRTGNKFADGLLMPIFAVAAVFLFVILCFYAYNHVMKNKNDGDVMVLQGDDSSFKVAPQDPGGMKVEHTDKAVFNTVTGQQENLDNTKVNTETEETPVSQQQLRETSSEVPPAPDSTQSTTVTIDPANPTANINPNSEIAAALNASKVANAQANGEEKAGISNSDKLVSVNPTEMPDAAPVKLNSTPDSSATNAYIGNSEVKSEPQQAEVTKQTDKTTGESKTVVQFKDTPKAPSKSASVAPSAGGKYFVQVSSHSSKSEAESAWKAISKKYSAELSGTSKNVTEAEVKGKKFYRLSFGPFADKSSASTKCGILKAKGQDCIIQKY